MVATRERVTVRLLPDVGGAKRATILAEGVVTTARRKCRLECHSFAHLLACLLARSPKLAIN